MCFLDRIFSMFIDFWLDLAFQWEPIWAHFGDILGFEIDAEK